MKISTGNKVNLGFISGLVVLIIVSVFSYQSVIQFSKLVDLRKHTYIVIENVEIILSLLKDAETGQRGYILTGKENYLEPYNYAVFKLDEQVKYLREITSDNANQQKRFDILEPLIKKNLDELKETINLRRTKGLEITLRLAALDKGKNYMDSIRKVIQEMKSEEKRLLKKRDLAVHANTQQVVLIILFGSFLAFVIVVISGLAINLDLSKRKQIEDALKSSEIRFRNFLENMPDAVVVVDKSGQIVLVNSEAEKIFSYHREELINKPLEILLPVNSQHAHVQHRTQYFTNPQKRSMGAGLNLMGKRKDGMIFPVDIELGPIETPDGCFVISTIRDTTVRKQEEEKMQKLTEELKLHTDELESTNKELEAFSYSVSHDLRAPLRSIDGFSKAILEDYSDKLDESGKDYLNRVRAATQRMAHLIDDMLTLSRITRAEMRVDTVNLTDIGKKISNELQKNDPNRKATFNIQEDLTTKGDPQLLRTVLENLFGNAWKFTAKKEEAKIEFGQFKQEDGKQAFFIKDNGAGFDMNYSSKLFGAFQRLHKQDEFAGTGIGLASVARVIHRHGGRVWAHGEVEKGATIYFAL